jgi:hypothetical protein
MPVGALPFDWRTLETPVQESYSLASRHWPASRPYSSSEHQEHLAYLDDDACFVNPGGDYRYMTSGSYTFQDREAIAAIVHPTWNEILDGYITPLSLKRPRLAWLRVALSLQHRQLLRPTRRR